MKKNKRKNSYKDYKDVPCDDEERLHYLIESLKLSKKDKEKLEQMRLHIDENIKDMKTIKLKIYTIPEGIGRPRFIRATGRVYNPNIQKFYNLMKKYIYKHPNTDVHYGCKIKCKFYFPIPKGMNKAEKILAEEGLITHIKKPDWDNTAKSTDMFNKVIWDDDSLVYSALIEKFYSCKPRIEIKIKYFLEPDCHYNECIIKNRMGENFNARTTIKFKKK